jgi:hypothetical protein
LQALQGEEPIYKVSTQKVEEASGEEGNEDEDEEWLQVEVELPLVSTAEQIDAYVEHMRFLHVQVPGLYTLKAELPEYVDDEDMECTYNTSSHTLKLRVPVVHP